MSVEFIFYPFTLNTSVMCMADLSRSEHAPQTAFGDGPHHAIFHNMISIILEDHHCWQKLGDYYIPHLLAIDNFKVPSRISLFWRDGAVAAVHMLRLGLGPDPLSPWCILAAIHGNYDAIPLSEDYIFALDPTSARLLSPWFRFSAQDTLPSQGYWQHPVAQLFINYLNEHDVSSSAF